MKTIKVVRDGKEIVFNLPTNIDSIQEDYLKRITNNVRVANHYTLIGLVRHSSLKSLIIACATNKKKVETGVVPIFIKCGETDNEFIKNIAMRDKLLVSPTEINLGHHVVVPFNELNIDNIIHTIADKCDKEEYQSYLNDTDDREVFFIEFKIVPNTAIIADYTDAEHTAESTYITINSIK